MENSSDEDIFSDNSESNEDINADSETNNNSETNTESEPNLIPEEVTRTIKIKKKPVEPVKEITRTIKIKKPVKTVTEQDIDDEEEERIQKVLKHYVKKQPQNLEDWVKARKYSKLQHLFGYTEDGDLEVGKVKEGDQKKIIVLANYKEATSDYIMQKKKEKDEQIKEAEEKYTEAKRNLQKIMNEYLASDKSDVDVSEVLRANEEVLNLEAALNTIVKYPRTIIREFNNKLIESDLSFNPHDKRPVVTNVFKVEYEYFSPEDLFMLADDENVLNLEGSNNNISINTNNSNDTTNNSNNSSMRGGKKPLSMAAIMAIKARKAGRGY